MIMFIYKLLIVEFVCQSVLWNTRKTETLCMSKFLLIDDIH